MYLHNQIRTKNGVESGLIDLSNLSKIPSQPRGLLLWGQDRGEEASGIDLLPSERVDLS